METPKPPQSPTPVSTQNPREAQREAQVQQVQQEPPRVATPHPAPPSRQQPPVAPTQPAPPVPNVQTPPAPQPIPPARAGQVPHRAPTPVPADLTPPARPTTLTTPHQLIAMLDEAAAMLARHPQGQETFMHEVGVKRAELAAVGFNPSPEEMQSLHADVAAMADKARIHEESRLGNTPPVTMDDIKALMDQATNVANRLHTGREGAMQSIESLRGRVDAAVAPHEQTNLDNLHVAALTLTSQLETQAGVQGV